MAESDDQTRKKVPFGEAFVVAATPGFGYLLSFTYQASYLGHWHLPYSMVNVSLRDVFVATSFVIVGFLVCFALVEVIAMSARSQAPGSETFLTLVAFAVIFTGGAIYLGLPWVISLVTGLYTGGSAIRYGIRTLIRHRPPASPPPITALLARQYGGLALIGVGAILLAIGVSVFVGIHRAETQSVWLMDSSRTEVILSVENEDALVAGVDGDRLTGAFHVVDLAKDGEVFALQRYGHLKPPRA